MENEKTYLAEGDTLKVVERKTETVEKTFNYPSLLIQRAAIIEQKNREIAARNAELAEVNELIEQAEQLGINQPVADEETE